MNRCADKILNQLEIHAKAELYFGGTENGGFEQNGQIRSILQRTSVRIDWIVVKVANLINSSKIY